MILYEIWARRLWRRLSPQKLRFIFGWHADPLALSRRYPVYRCLQPWRLLCRPAYARSVATLLEYRLDLFDGHQG